MQTFNIVKTIDLDYLDKKIKEYIAEKEQKPYIFMNAETIKTVFNTANIYKPYLSVCYEYEGCKVFTNDDLQYGEVELR